MTVSWSLEQALLSSNLKLSIVKSFGFQFGFSELPPASVSVFILRQIKLIFTKKGFALTLVLKVRVLRTRKWHTDYQNIFSFRGKKKKAKNI